MVKKWEVPSQNWRKKTLKKWEKKPIVRESFKQFLKKIKFYYDFSHETGNRRFVGWVWNVSWNLNKVKILSLTPLTNCHDDKKNKENFQSQFQEEFRSFCPKGLLTRKALTSIYAKNFPDGDPTHFANIGLIFFILYQ